MSMKILSFPNLIKYFGVWIIFGLKLIPATRYISSPFGSPPWNKQWSWTRKRPRAVSLSSSFFFHYFLTFPVNFETLDQGLVIQETRAFGEIPMKVKKCEIVLMKLLYLLYNGTKFSEEDATIVFFAVTKTFQSKEVS